MSSNNNTCTNWPKDREQDMPEKGKPGRLFVVSGPSGAGKSSLIRRFLAEDSRSTFSVSCTTRQRRDTEVAGKDYHFINTSTFRQMIKENAFLEWENVHGYYYGTPGKGIVDELRRGTDVILDIDVKGALAVQKRCPAACLIFIEPPSKEELVQRLILRGEKEIDRRMQIVCEEMEKKTFFGYSIINKDFNTAYSKFLETIKTEREKANGENNC